ncbi:hypothetical protein ACFLSX_03845 [Calditrichota bacterium]
MKTKHILISVVSFLMLMQLTGCYTSMGTVRYHRIYDEEVVYEDEDLSDNTISAYHHYYSRPYVSHRFVYYDPYDYWYDNPGFYISLGYYNRPYYYYSNYYGCVYTGWYPVVYRPYYVPAWYYTPRHHKQFYAYNRRDFNKRQDLAGRQFNRRNNRSDYGNYNEGGFNSGSGIGINNNENNYGRRIISRRTDTGINRNESTAIASRKNVITKRQTNRLVERSIKSRPVEEKKINRIERNRTSREEQVKRYFDIKTSRNEKPKEIVMRPIERRSNNTKQKYQNSKEISENKVKQKRSAAIRNNANDRKEKNKSTTSRSYRRPKARESSKSSVSKQAKRSGSSRSSYSPKKSSSKSSSSSSRKRGRK